MIKKLNFLDTKQLIEDKNIRDRVFKTEDGKSSFKVDNEGKIVDLNIKDFSDEFVIFEQSVDEFIEVETENKRKFIEENLPTDEELSEFGFNDLVEFYYKGEDIKWEPEYKYDEKVVEDRKKKLDVKVLNSGTNISNEVRDDRVLEKVIENNLRPWVKNVKDVVSDIKRIEYEDYNESEFSNRVYFIEDLVGLVNLAVGDE